MDNQKTRGTGNRKNTRIGKDEIERARRKLELYKAAKSSLNANIKFNEKWYRQRHMEYIRTGEKLQSSTLEGDTVPHYRQGEQVEPVSAWLFNSVQNFHADYMDNFPRANVLPREKGDTLEAEKLTRILPALLDRIGFEAVYSRAGWTKAIQGWSVYTVTWDKEADGGRGEISIGRAKLLNLYWDMEVDDIQASSDLFYLHERDRDELIREYPKLEKDLIASDGEYERHDDVAAGPNATKITVVDHYYRKRGKDGKKRLHLCQFAGDVLLYASENEKATAERGLYDHGKYPFVVDILYPMEDAAYGFGKVAVGSSKQAYIDILSQSIMKNALWSSAPRYFAKIGHGFNMADFLDLGKKVIEVEGDPNEYLMPVDVKPIDGNALNLRDSLVEELRETTNMRDVATGSTTGGVTAASGIAALQEAAGKMSRDSNRTSFRAFREIIVLVIELIRQFYTETHYFRVLNEEDGEQVYLAVDNSGMGEGALFDLEITTERSSTYTRMAQNELMLSFYNAGFFNPQTSDQALACLRMMDFEGKEELIRMIGENRDQQELLSAILEQMVAMAQAYDNLAADVGIESNETEQAQALAQQVLSGGAMQTGTPRAAEVPETSGESSVTKNAREGAASVASPM